MQTVIASPGALPDTRILAAAITLLGLAAFAYLLWRRVEPLRTASPDPRFQRRGERLGAVLKYWLAQYKQPRYPLAGALHILLFAGFLILALRSLNLIILGFYDGFVIPGLGGAAGQVYAALKDYTATVVLAVVLLAGVRRAFFAPARYAVPARFGKAHTGEALLVLGLIATLMVSESLFDASRAAAFLGAGVSAENPAWGSLGWWLMQGLIGVRGEALQDLHLGSYFLHDLTFFAFMCFLPMGKHFHVITSLPNVLLLKLDKGSVKPVLWGVSDQGLDDLDSFGVKQFQDFTWKHVLDFYSCADCGRCSDNCPANAVGRPLSPRFFTIKARDYAFRHFAISGSNLPSEPLVGGIYEEDEIWSCTTCGACEEECPLLIEYIDKIVDLRRGLVDEGKVPPSLQQPLAALDKRGNPFGKKEKARADWADAEGFKDEVEVRLLADGELAEVLYFVDSMTSYDPRMQEIARSASRLLGAADLDFGILGKAERDSGHEVRRFGEEMLFQNLREENTEAIAECGAKRIITTDPHAFNALRKDYQGLPPVEHISQTLAGALAAGRIRFREVDDRSLVYTYHDPCYLGRHNSVYDAPRQVLDAIPGLKRVEMARCRDRSFCCGGGGLMLFYEPVEEARMGQKRVQMAKGAGADVIVTACPFCLANIEDAIKTSGLEGQMRVMDLVELAAQQVTHGGQA